MDIYEESVKEVKNNIKNPHVLILGATPEIRDLVLDYKMNLTILDQSKEMIEKMNSLMKNKNSDLEKIELGNWLSKPFPDDSFDLVLGDGVSNNIEYRKQESFFEEIKRVLKKNGVMLLREGVLKKDIPCISVQEALTDYRATQDFPTLFLRLNLYSEVSCYNKEKNYFDMGEMFNKLKDCSEIFSKKEFEKIMSWRGSLKHTVLEIDELKKIIKSVFGNVDVINSESNFVLNIWPFFKVKNS